MATILAYTSPAIGHLFPMTPVLLELQRRGHTVHVRTLADRVALMQELGLHAAALDPRIEQIEHRDFEAKSAKAALAAAADVFARRGALDAPAMTEAISELRPDAVIVDINSWGAAFAAEAWGGPWASFSPYTPALHSPGTPPFGPGLPPMGGPLGRLRDAVVGRLVLGAVEETLAPRINGLRSSLGLAPVTSADEFQRKAPLLLVATAKPFEYETTDWGPDVRLIGAMTWEPPQDAPDWLDNIDRPIVLVTTSSEFQDDGILVRTALAAFRNQPVHVVATMPAGADLGTEVPANATVAPFLPHNAVLDRAVLAVTHGGMGATQKALAHGVPVCVVPFGRDQLEVARRVEVSGAGTRLPRRRLSPDRLAAAATTAMTRSAGAKRVAEGFVAAGGPRAAADALERRLLTNSGSGTAPAAPHR